MVKQRLLAWSTADVSLPCHWLTPPRDDLAIRFSDVNADAVTVVLGPAASEVLFGGRALPAIQLGEAAIRHVEVHREGIRQAGHAHRQR